MRIIKLSNKGDTIVEVLIVLAVLGFALSIASATSRQGTIKSRNAQEHSQALGILNSQVELVRKAVASKKTLPAGTFCMSDINTDASFGGQIPADSANDDDPAMYPPGCVQNSSGIADGEGIYRSSISRNDDLYTFKVRWAGAGGLNGQQETFTYRVHDLTDPDFVPIPVSNNLPRIDVIAKVLQPGPGNTTPSCTSTTVGSSLAGTTIQLNDLSGDTYNGGTKTTDSTSTATFMAGVNGYRNYSATITNLSSSYKVCSTSNTAVDPPTISGSVFVPPTGNMPTINMRVQPQCRDENHDDFVRWDRTYLGSFPDYIGTWSDGSTYIPNMVRYEDHYDRPLFRDDYRRKGGFFDSGNTFDFGTIQFRVNRGLGYSSAGWFYEHWDIKYYDAGGYWQPWPAVPHYTEPRDHYSPYYQVRRLYTIGICPSYSNVVKNDRQVIVN